MEIINRTKGKADGEVVPWNENEENVREEVNRRSAKAGYTNRNGGPINGTKIMSRGIGKSKKLNVWPRDEQGNLIGD